MYTTYCVALSLVLQIHQKSPFEIKASFGAKINNKIDEYFEWLSTIFLNMWQVA